AGAFEPASLELEEVRRRAPRRRGAHRRRPGREAQPAGRQHRPRSPLRGGWRAAGAPGAARAGREGQEHRAGLHPRPPRHPRRLRAVGGLGKLMSAVAAGHGPALGGSLELALGCTYRIASADRKTQLGQPEVQLGLIPGGGRTQRLPALIGIAQAIDLILTGKSVRAAKARKLGLVDDVVPRAILVEVARRRARELAEGELRIERNKVEPKVPKLLHTEVLQQIALEDNPVGRKILFQQARKALLAKTHGHYPAPERALEAIRIGVEKGTEEGYRAEANFFGELVASDVSRRLVEIFFATQTLKKD